mmetsp:Transcript_4499/g.8667  ORF Transcript_4499/g.8667 Transcript_4499/m.8667 type:complete len:341 (+) Transcript_4499:199-1221(+)|eukprot:CAMPEP_0204916660 /NCGR_PEP_ID=MMETSP1397-20131031/14426_1 /ASSEMBLY_ACC=CAM_ASM_000891 /TAXON_ID=49980 /ORGANISM="Climacostomum Climacostomum virens, Strain Stock W-24" /LENGTH=340 /DNA_ID=CAMNT_0052089253 /DNA_START=184 /DNA_END=1206 /DNA_ORIENTATION=-
MIKKYLLTCFGNPLIDVIAQAPLSLLEKYQLRLDNAVLANETHNGLYEEILKLNPLLVPGGSALNTARVASWMLRQTFPVSFVGSLGNDKHGDLLVKLSKAEGVDLLAERQSMETGHCLVLVNNKDRSLVTSPGASRNFSDDFLRLVWPAIENSYMLYFEGFFLRSSVKAMEEIIHNAVAKDVPIGINLSSIPIVSDYIDFFIKHLPHFDYIFGNEGEALIFAQRLGIQHNTLEEVGRLLARHKKNAHKPRNVIITRGANPVIVAMPNRVFTVDIPLLDDSKIVDKNGAGDAFTGGFLAAAVSGCSIENCTDAGLYASNEIIQASGCQLTKDSEFVLSLV